MDSKEFLQYQIEHVGKQLFCVLGGFGEDGQGCRLREDGMTVGEQTNHLADVYQAVMAMAEGKEYAWGTFQLQATDPAGAVEELKGIREQAAAAVVVDDPTKLKIGADFIVAHDAYHVGQLVSQRIVLDPSWDSYEIYS